MKKILLAGMLVLAANTAFSQSTGLLQAFIRSYDSEGKKDYTTAIKQLSELYDKNSYEINLRLGWLNYEAKLYNESKKYYQTAIEIMPNALEPKVGYLYPTVALNEIDKLSEQYAKILKIDEQDVNSNYQLGYINYNKKNIDIAKSYFQKIINLYPSGYESYLRDTWSKITKQKAQSEKVVAAFKTSYELESKKKYQAAIDVLIGVYDKSYYDINLRLGWLNYISLQDSDAVKYYQIAIELQPKATEARFGLVNAANELGNYNDVFSQYKKILEIDPMNTYALYGMGQIHYNRKEYDLALPFYEKVVGLYPFTYNGLHMLAWTNLRLEKTVEAKTLFNRVLLLSPKDNSTLDGLKILK